MRYELGFISQKTAFFIVTAVKTSNLPRYNLKYFCIVEKMKVILDLLLNFPFHSGHITIAPASPHLLTFFQIQTQIINGILFQSVVPQIRLVTPFLVTSQPWNKLLVF
jgi:hypothetical protein